MERASGLDPVAVKLRQEVNFCCPIPGCKSPLLTYHHFDPPWRERQHNDQHGMIALCWEHHQKAEGGWWTKEQLRMFKRSPKPPNVVRDLLLAPEPGKRSVYLIGGSFAIGCPIIISLADQILLKEDITPNGIPLLSLFVLDSRNKQLLNIHQNSMAVDAAKVWDCYYSAQAGRLLIREKRGKIAVDLRFLRMPFDKFKQLAQRTLNDTTNIPEKFKNPFLGNTFNEGIEHPSLATGFLEDIISKRCVNSDGNVCLTQIERANLYANGRWLPVKRGALVGGGVGFFGCTSIDSPVAFPFPGFRRLHRTYASMKEKFTLDDAFIITREKLIEEGRPVGKMDNAIARIYSDACQRWPALMSVAAGLHAWRMGNAASQQRTRH